MRKTRIVRQLRHGQVTIPKEFRELLEIEKDDLLAMSVSGRKIEITPVRVTSSGGSAWAKELYDLYAPVRKSLEGVPEEEINVAIDEVVRKVRAEKR